MRDQKADERKRSYGPPAIYWFATAATAALFTVPPTAWGLYAIITQTLWIPGSRFSFAPYAIRGDAAVVGGVGILLGVASYAAYSVFHGNDGCPIWVERVAAAGVGIGAVLLTAAIWMDFL